MKASPNYDREDCIPSLVKKHTASDTGERRRFSTSKISKKQNAVLRRSGMREFWRISEIKTMIKVHHDAGVPICPIKARNETKFIPGY